MRQYHLAQVNIARMRATLSDPVMAGLAARVDEMNRLAERSTGFVWRLRGEEITHAQLRVFEKYFVPFHPARLFYNLSVWDSMEDLQHICQDLPVYVGNGCCVYHLNATLTPDQAGWKAPLS